MQPAECGTGACHPPAVPFDMREQSRYQAAAAQTAADEVSRAFRPRAVALAAELADAMAGRPVDLEQLEVQLVRLIEDVAKSKKPGTAELIRVINIAFAIVSAYLEGGVIDDHPRWVHVSHLHEAAFGRAHVGETIVLCGLLARGIEAVPAERAMIVEDYLAWAERENGGSLFPVNFDILVESHQVLRDAHRIV